jgi:hypothetical protein
MHPEPMTPTRFDTAASKFAPIGIYRPLKPRTDRTKEIYPLKGCLKRQAGQQQSKTAMLQNTDICSQKIFKSLER